MLYIGNAVFFLLPFVYMSLYTSDKQYYLAGVNSVCRQDPLAVPVLARVPSYTIRLQANNQPRVGFFRICIYRRPTEFSRVVYAHQGHIDVLLVRRVDV